MSAPWELLPSLAFGVPFSVHVDKKVVYITPEGRLVCPHGECGSTICAWITAEKTALRAGQPQPPRGGGRALSCCTCQSSEGLHVSTKHAEIPPPPGPLFDFLRLQNAEVLTLKGRESRRIPHLEGPTYLTACGRLHCAHGRARGTLLRRSICGCVLRPLPKRAHHKIGHTRKRSVCVLPVIAPALQEICV